jgi:hypothetical protein
MVEHKCRRCGYITDNKTNIKTHLSRKKECEAKYEDISRNVLLEGLLSSRQFKEKIYPCKYCDKKFADLSNRSKHQKKCRNLESKIIILEKELQKLKSTVNNTNKSERNIIAHSGNGDINYNHINNTYNMALNPYDKVVKDTYPKIMFTEEMRNKLLSFIDRPNDAVIEYNKEKFFSPDRKNDQCIRMTEEDRNNIINLWSKDNKWDQQEPEKVINECIFYTSEFFRKIVHDIMKNNTMESEYEHLLKNMVSTIFKTANYLDPDNLIILKDKLADVIVEMSKKM